ncbi:Vgb family protein [Kordiimonas aquimaris]|uniref:Vgb family protein n=1 Tax=Kordiimonas aquimaris TaxID=707591 RepID=UPI0021D16F70|nr:hypothetical protein [Kordiimonas aquimaris]
MMQQMFSSKLVLISAALCALNFSAEAQELPDGTGKETVTGVCTACHTTRNIVRSSGYNKDGWAELTATMVDLSADPETLDEITGYLAMHFPPNDNRVSTIVGGNRSVTFKEWTVPTLGQRSRDPVEAPDGSIWWAGQWGNLIGRIDPGTGEMTEYPLPPNAMPHSVTSDAAGNIWYTGNKNGTMGKLNPETGEITEYKMPDPNARDPHTAVFDKAGILWFTLQQSNMIGRLDPETGDIRLVTMPTPRSRPYGIKVAADGSLWVACNGSNCLVNVNNETMELAEVKLPIPATTVRRLDIDENGVIWYGNASQGRLGRYDPSNGHIMEWPSPSGPKSHPYGMVVAGGAVWYNESGVRPDALVRFDPKTETFQSWAMPSGGVHAGIIRHMRTDSDGNILAHQSSTNRIIKVMINPVDTVGD